MMQKSVLITGANSGFGKRIALTFARAGYTVYATSRNLSSLGVKELSEIAHKEKLQIEWFKLDVTKQEDVDIVYKELQEKGLDILINNAGFGILGPIEEYALSDFQKQFDTNFFGVVRMTYAFLPLLKKSSCPKIITISSIAGLIVAPAYGVYASSKHAVEVFMETLRYELFNTNIKVSLVEPGGFDTQFSANSPGLNAGGNESQIKTHWYKRVVAIRNKHIGAENNIVNKKRDPQLVANLVLKIAKQHSPRLRHTIGQGATISYFLRKIIPDGIWGWGMQAVLRRFS